MFDNMLENTEGLENTFEKRNRGKNKRKLIKDLIKGKKPEEGTVTQVVTVYDKE